MMGSSQEVGHSPLNGMLPYVAWVIALVGMAGSLFFSDVMGAPPCVLCWYQRIAMYPLVAIIGLGIAYRDASWRRYALPLAIIGLVIAAYHNLVYYGVIPEALTPCTQGVSCSERQIEWFGFVTIPLMSLLAFAVITAAIAAYRPEKKL